MVQICGMGLGSERERERERGGGIVSRVVMTAADPVWILLARALSVPAVPTLAAEQDGGCGQLLPTHGLLRGSLMDTNANDRLAASTAIDAQPISAAVDGIKP